MTYKGRGAPAFARSSIIQREQFIIINKIVFFVNSSQHLALTASNQSNNAVLLYLTAVKMLLFLRAEVRQQKYISKKYFYLNVLIWMPLPDCSFSEKHFYLNVSSGLRFS